MHIFRWLMSHPIITAWILAALAILLNINMGSKNGHSDTEQSTEHVNGEVSHVVVPENTSEENQESVHAQDTGSAEAVFATNKTDVNTVAVPTAVHTHSAELEARFAEETQRAANDADVEESNNEVQIEDASTQETAIGTESTAKEQDDSSGVSTSSVEGSNSTTEGSSNAEDLIAMSSDDLLKLAREAFWQNKKDKSAAIYQALVKRVPSSLDYKGELANVLWHQNKQKESAVLYAEIAMPMLKEGKSREVSNMLGFIGVFFPEKASEIHRAMSE